jgi:hypothetical protein
MSRASIGGGVYRGGGIPGAARQCPICNTLVVVEGPCPTCGGDPGWLLRQNPGAVTTSTRPTGQQRAQATMAALQPEPAEPSEPQTLELRVVLQTAEAGPAGPGLTHAWIYGPENETYHGDGATIQEAVISALAALEDEMNKPHCPTCGQVWPEGREILQQ